MPLDRPGELTKGRGALMSCVASAVTPSARALPLLDNSRTADNRWRLSNVGIGVLFGVTITANYGMLSSWTSMLVGRVSPQAVSLAARTIRLLSRPLPQQA